MESPRVCTILMFAFIISVSAFAQRGPSPGELATAVAVGDLSGVDALLHRGADPDQSDSSGQTPLCYAVLSGRFELVERMLATTADPDKPGRNGMTPLMNAVELSREDLVILLLSAGAEPNRISDISIPASGSEKKPASPLSLAVNRGEVALARRLFHAGADPGRLTSHGAVDPLNLPVVDVALDARIWQDMGDIRDSADSPDWDSTALDDPWRLHRAAENNDWNAGREALDSGSDVNIADERGVTPLMIASWHGYASMVSLFQQRGADPGATDNQGRSALSYAAAAGNIGIIDRLLSAPGAIDRARTLRLDSLRQSPLYYALISSEPLVLTKLVEAGISVTVADDEGVTLLMMAAWLGDLHSASLLSSESYGGARDSAGRTALAWGLAAFDRNRQTGRESGDHHRGSRLYPLIRLLAARLRNPALYSTQPSRDLIFGEYDATEAWAPGRVSDSADILRNLRPSPVPMISGDGDLTVYRILRDEEPGIPASD